MISTSDNFRNLHPHLFSWVSRDMHLHFQGFWHRRSFNEESPVKNWLSKIWSLFTQIGTYGAQNNHKAAPRWMYHNHFLPCSTTRDSGRPRCSITYTMLMLIYANTAQNSLQALSLGGSLSLMTLMRSPLPARNFQSPLLAQVIIQSPKNITLMARENNCLQLSFNDVSETRSWSFMLEKKR